MIRNLTAKRCVLVLIGRKLNGGGLICESRYIFQTGLKWPELVVEEPVQTEKCYDLAQAQPPWPIMAPIYGEGLRSYGRLLTPTYESSSTWLFNVSQRATTDAVICGKELINILLKNDMKTPFLLLICKSKQMIQFLFGESYKNNGQITSMIHRKKMRLPENYLWNNKAKVELLDNLYLLLLKSKEVSKLVSRKIKDEDIPLKLLMLSKQTGDKTVSLIKAAKIPDRFMEKSNKLVSMVMVNSVTFYSRSKEFSKIQAFLTRKFGEFSLKLSKSYSKVPFKVGILTKSEHFKAFQDIIQSSKLKSLNPSNTYVNKFFDRSAKQGLDSLTSVVQTNKPEYTAVTPSKQRFHSSAVRIYRPIKRTLYDNPLYWIVLKSETISDLKLVREISRLIPGPFKKIWRGIRDKSLPSWQATIASVLQKIQDSVVKKKK